MGARLVGKKLPWRRTGEPCAPRQEKLDNRLRPDACGKSTAECYCTKLRTVSKSLIINEIVVEATGVELFRVLITRNLLIPRSATTAKKAPLPDPLYVYCTERPFVLKSNRHTRRPKYRIDSERWIEKTPGFPAIP